MTSQQKILVVDDEPHIVNMLKEWLEEEGYRVCVASKATEALRLFFDQHPALSIVDLRMPGMDGFQLISRLRELSGSRILILSALTGDEAVVRGLNVGADEYVFKPVSREPFLARVRAIMRQDRQQAGELISGYADGVLSLNVPAHSVTVAGQQIHLSPLEFRLLAYLVQHRQRVISHDELLNRVWGTELGSLDSLKWYVSSLRRKLQVDPGLPQLIVNERGLGYRYHPAQTL
ncbi:MAG: response regulator transcription factor [Chloroflexi bacterium]|nr:response regulator transcription factor [Chloroflexota bacterium]